jgi:hypothetical protein
MKTNLEKLVKLRDITSEVFTKDFRNVDSAKYLLQYN